jgi:hypothetical protein
MNRLAVTRSPLPEERGVTPRKATRGLLTALADFANLADDRSAIARFRRRHPGFQPFQVAGSSAMLARFRPALLAYRELLRRVWRGSADGWELLTLLGLNPAAFGEWHGTADAVNLWNEGLNEIRGAGLDFFKTIPVLRASWELGTFSYASGSPFQNAVFILWQARWRARICPTCDSYFIAAEKADKYCSCFCAREGKNKRNRQWWRDRGPEWRKQYFAERKRAEAEKKQGGSKGRK